MEVRRISQEEWQSFIEDNFKGSIFESPTYFKPIDLGSSSLFISGGFLNEKLKWILVGSLNRKYRRHYSLNAPTYSFGTAPLIEDSDNIINHNEIAANLDSFLKQNRIVEVIGYTDNENLAKELGKRDFKVEKNAIAFIDLSIDIDAIFSNFKESNRRAIRKAIKNGVEVKKEDSDSVLPEIYALLQINAQEKGYSMFEQESFIKRISNYMQNGICDIWTARKENEIIGCVVVYHNGADSYYMYGASAGLGNQLRANNLLHWKIIDHYKKLEYKKYIMGFIRSYEPFGREKTGYGEFKRTFGPELLPHYKYSKIYDKKTYWLDRILNRFKTKYGSKILVAT